MDEELILDLTTRKRGSVKNNISKCPKCGEFGKKNVGNYTQYIHKYYRTPVGLTRVESCLIKKKEVKI